MWAWGSWAGVAWLWLQEEARGAEPCTCDKEKAHLDFTLKTCCVSNAAYTKYLKISGPRTWPICPATRQQQGWHTTHDTSRPLRAVVSFISQHVKDNTWIGSMQRALSCACGNLGSSSLFHGFVRMEKRWWLEQWANEPKFHMTKVLSARFCPPFF